MQEELYWRPIETCPKEDDAEFLVYKEFATVPIVHLAFYRKFNEAAECCGWTKEDEGIWTYPEHSITQMKLDGAHTPLYWMPLPSLPK